MQLEGVLPKYTVRQIFANNLLVAEPVAPFRLPGEFLEFKL